MPQDPVPFKLRAAELRDVQAIVGLIRELAVFEKLEHLMQATPEKLRPHLFGEKPVAEAIVAELDGDVVGFALFFTNFSTFLAQPGLYLEDLYVRPVHRGAGIGQALLQRLAQLAVDDVVAAASSGRCSIGTSTRSASTNAWAPP